ncbi:pseudouridine synthase [Haloferula sp.]|uniref:pseudouridine synthase n=1 Tax=Haloferula sp. TaxID=2497595 RepID=UPI003C73C752
MSDGTRLNKYLASCGVGSRRACDLLVQEGHVEINGHPCLSPAQKVQPGDFVKVDGRRVIAKQTNVIMMHKPRGLVCTKADELGRNTIYELLPGSLQHLNHVGRLDRESEGLLIMTNDGTLSQSLLHPSKNIEKEYIVTANQIVRDDHLDQFLSGLYTEDGKLQAKEIERLSPRRIRIVLITGHKRQIRMMFKTLGYSVQRLVRIRIGSFQLTDIPPGKWRPISEEEIALIKTNPEKKKRIKARRTPRSKEAKEAGRRPARKAAKKAAKKSLRRPPAGLAKKQSLKRKY